MSILFPLYSIVYCPCRRGHLSALALVKLILPFNSVLVGFTHSIYHYLDKGIEICHSTFSFGKWQYVHNDGARTDSDFQKSINYLADQKAV
jgi:site-specific recombinase